MKKGMPGHGAVSIILVFTVLCMTLFAVITFSQASTDKALADAAAQMVIGYYDADTLAERVLAELRAGIHEKENVLGVEVNVADIGGSSKVSFSIPVTLDKELTVEAVIRQHGYEILVWKMVDIGVWVPDIYHPLPGVDAPAPDADQPLFFDFVF